MTLLHALTLGIIEGLTEFLPVSSTAHLIITSNLLKLPSTDSQKFFEVFIQSGAILAVIFLYSQYIITHFKVTKKLVASFFPTAIIGFGLYKIIKMVFFESSLLIIGALAVIGIAFIILEMAIRNRRIKLNKEISQISNFQAVLIGLIQALAVVPGVSRSGIVMVGMMLMGYRRDEAAKYSFLLAVPTIIAASGYDLWKMRSMIVNSSQFFSVLLVGTITSFVVTYLVMRWLIGFLQRNTLIPFGIYRVGLAIILMLFFI